MARTMAGLRLGLVLVLFQWLVLDLVVDLCVFRDIARVRSQFRTILSFGITGNKVAAK
jgi:hypothetical protein